MTERRVRVHPTGTHIIPGVRAVERLVPSDVADVLLEHTPAAFTREAPGELADEPLEDLADVYTEFPELDPDRPATSSTVSSEAGVAGDGEEGRSDG